MANTIFRKVTYKCAGCGRTKEAKVQVPAAQAAMPLKPPDGWGTLDLVGQNLQNGTINGISIPVCSEECGRKTAAGEGDPAMLTYMKDCQAIVAGDAKVIREEPKLLSPVGTPPIIHPGRGR